MKYSIGIGILLVGVGCSSLSEYKMGEVLPSADETFKLKLDSKGRIFVSQRLSAKGRPVCEKLKADLSVSIKRESDGEKIAVEESCTFLPGRLVAIAKDNAAKGEYMIALSRGGKADLYDAKPFLGAKYVDPEFNSGTDYVVDGATELPKGQSAKGIIAYANGNRTDWIRLKGKNARVGLTLLENADAREVGAEVYKILKGGGRPVRIATLLPKKKRSFQVTADDLLVKLTAESYEGAMSYSLLRSDEAGGKKINIPVVDCYPVDEDSSIVLLGKADAVKVGDEITVFGKTTAGERVTVGTCQITSLSENGASCRMAARLRQTYLEFRAEGKSAEGET